MKRRKVNSGKRDHFPMITQKEHEAMAVELFKEGG